MRNLYGQSMAKMSIQKPIYMMSILPTVFERRQPGRPITQRNLGEKAIKTRKMKERPLVIKGGQKLRRQQRKIKCKRCGKECHNSKYR